MPEVKYQMPMVEGQWSMVNGQMSKVRFAFFGTDEFSIGVLEELKSAGFIPSLIVTAPDKPRGRKLVMTAPPVKVWAQKNNVQFLQPEKLDSSFIGQMSKVNCQLFIVASYGKIIPEKFLQIPAHQTLNVHPSILPKLRGPSPLETAILEEKETGVTIMRLDEEMDHGPIAAQKKISVANWPPRYEDLENLLSREGGKLLSEILPSWLSGEILPTAQDDLQATYTKKITKEDGRIDLSDNPEKNFRKIQAFHKWPKAYFFIKHGDTEKRIIITDAELENNLLVIKKVIPEGKKEMSYRDFIRGYKTTE